MIGPFGHLGARATALVDNRLTPAERTRALEHVASCEACAELVAEQRGTRRRAACLGAPDVPASLQERLLALPRQDAVAMTHPAPWHAERARSRAPRVVLVSAASVVGLGVAASGALYGLGTPRPRTPDALAQAAVMTAAVAYPAGVRPADLDNGSDDGSGDGSGPGTDAWPSGVAAPATLPGVVTSASAVGDGVAQVVLDVDGAAVTVLESRGRLDLTGADVDQTVRLGSLEVHRVGEWWLAQVGDDVVAVAGPTGACHEVLNGFGDAGTSVVQRVQDGWTVLVGGLG